MHGQAGATWPSWHRANLWSPSIFGSGLRQDKNKERASNARSVAPAAVHRANELPCASARTSPNESPRCTYTPTIHLSVHRRRREPLTPFKLRAIDPSVWKSLIQDSSKKPVWMPSCGANDLAKVFGGAFAKVGKNESLPILPKVFAHD